MSFKVVMAVGLLLVSGCSTTGTGSIPANSALAAGADSGTVATRIIDAMEGGLIGGSIGEGLDRAERRAALEAEYRALERTPSGEKVAWGNDGGVHGEVVASQAYRVGSQDCRQYRHTVMVAGAPRMARGTACRNPNGSWTPLT